MIKRFWKWLATKSNRESIALIGGGAAVVVGGLWTAFVFWSPKHQNAPSTSVTIDARCGGVGIGGNVSGTTITAGSAGAADCSTKPK